MSEVKIITLDPGHFHAGLIQKQMYPGVSRRVDVYAPLGFDLTEHLNRIARFNLRKEKPTAWELEVHTGADFFERMLRERPGNCVVISGRNRGKIDRIKACVDAGLNVLADKPWIISAADMPKLESSLDVAARKGLVAFDIMTERYEITTILQRELINDSAVFGSIVAGTRDEPGVFMESVHHLMKVVAGAPNIRPAWFFDVNQQGEGVADVGTHLVDLVQWMLFPEQAIDYHKDVNVLAGRRWATVINKSDFSRVTGESTFPSYLAPSIDQAGLNLYCNGEIGYTLRGIHAKLKIVWNYEAPPGTGDTHLAAFKGTRSTVEVRQGKDENYRTEVYVVPATASTKTDVIESLERKITSLQTRYPGIAVEDLGSRVHIVIPDKYRVGHEEHFGQVAERFLEYFRNHRSLPSWEKPNMVAKYYVTTRAVEMSRKNH
jgi:predicted dehydrogenase